MQCSNIFFPTEEVLQVLKDFLVKGQVIWYYHEQTRYFCGKAKIIYKIENNILEILGNRGYQIWPEFRKETKPWMFADVNWTRGSIFTSVSASEMLF